MNENNPICSNGNAFGSQEAKQEDEVFSVGLENLAENVKMALLTERTCLFLFSYITMLHDSATNFMLSNIIKKKLS